VSPDRFLGHAKQQLEFCLDIEGELPDLGRRMRHPQENERLPDGEPSLIKAGDCLGWRRVLAQPASHYELRITVDRKGCKGAEPGQGLLPRTILLLI